jgi:hypothetical protein
VSYVPAAALVLRLSAVVDVADGPNVFDPALRFGEDVDLVWRLHEAGWRIRYEPGVQVGHDEPDSWSGLLARRFRYGTSAAPLALRHREAMAPIVLRPLPALAVLGLLAGRGDVGAGAYVSSVVTARRSLQSAGLPTSQVPARMLVAVHQTWLAAGRYCTWFAAPVLFGALLAPRRSRRTLGLRRRGRRLAAASLLLGPPLTAWASRHPDLDPPRFVLGHIADDIAYGIGVLVGCRRSRTLIPVRPVVLRHGPNQAAPRTV